MPLLTTKEELRKKVMREKGTEQPFSGELLYNKAGGVYKCAECARELFSSDAKFDSGCGWPSFDRPITDESVGKKPDTSHSMVRTEVICPKCGGHLGHVFKDGLTETGLRYCINSAALEFEETD